MAAHEVGILESMDAWEASSGPDGDEAKLRDANHRLRVQIESSLRRGQGLRGPESKQGGVRPFERLEAFRVQQAERAKQRHGSPRTRT